MPIHYPDVSELLKRKEERRQHLARLPFEEKIAIVLRLQQLARARDPAPPTAHHEDLPNTERRE